MSANQNEILLVDRFTSELENSPFNKYYHSADLPLDSFLAALCGYLDYDASKRFRAGELSLDDLVALIQSRVPEFQRDNNKWSDEMQTLFVHNVLRGFRGGNITLYNIHAGSRDDCFILDGLQRVTAICRYFQKQDMEFKLANGETISAKTLLNKDNGFSRIWNLVVPVRIYNFRSELEAVDFYIEMNEGITHSPEDIEKARRYRATITG